MDVFELAKTISTRDVVEQYGFNVNRNGQICCPFHSDSHPSLKVYPGNRGWYCFVCACGGDSVAFVSKLFNVNRLEAAKKICGDFGLIVDDSDTEYKSVYKQRQREREDRIETWNAHAIESNALHHAVLKKPLSHKQASKYGRMIARLEYLEYWFENSPLKGEL